MADLKELTWVVEAGTTFLDIPDSPNLPSWQFASEWLDFQRSMNLNPSYTQLAVALRERDRDEMGIEESWEVYLSQARSWLTLINEADESGHDRMTYLTIAEIVYDANSEVKDGIQKS